MRGPPGRNPPWYIIMVDVDDASVDDSDNDDYDDKRTLFQLGLMLKGAISMYLKI